MWLLSENRIVYWLILSLTMIGLTACNYPQEVVTPVEAGEAGIAGRIWHDVCAAPGPDQALPSNPPDGCVLGGDGSFYMANGRLDQNEAGIGGVEVRLGEGACPSFGYATTRTEPDGLYLFGGLVAGNYCVSVDAASASNSGILLPGTWTYPGLGQSEDVIMTQVELEPEEIQADVYFAWDYELLPPYQPAESPLPPTQTVVPQTDTPTFTTTPGATPTPTLTPTEEVTTTPTLNAEDPRSTLKNPTWVDNFQDASDWALYTDTHASFEIGSDGLDMTAYNPDFFNSWVLSWRRAEDLYLEATGTFGQCGGRDAYGLMVRSTGGDNGYIGYLFGISCDGRYSLRSWDGDSMGMIVGWTPDESINAGPEATNRVGIWADGNQLSLYVNGEFLV
ncbi:MAG: SdrD B-like domain-containing protein, partial [Anaerolineales bacterium]